MGGTGWRMFMDSDWSAYPVSQFSVAMIGQTMTKRSPGLSEKCNVRLLFVTSKQAVESIEIGSIEG